MVADIFLGDFDMAFGLKVAIVICDAPVDLFIKQLSQRESCKQTNRALPLTSTDFPLVSKRYSTAYGRRTPGLKKDHQTEPYHSPLQMVVFRSSLTNGDVVILIVETKSSCAANCSNKNINHQSVGGHLDTFVMWRAELNQATAYKINVTKCSNGEQCLGESIRHLFMQRLAGHFLSTAVSRSDYAGGSRILSPTHCMLHICLSRHAQSYQTPMCTCHGSCMYISLPINYTSEKFMLTSLRDTAKPYGSFDNNPWVC